VGHGGTNAPRLSFSSLWEDTRALKILSHCLSGLIGRQEDDIDDTCSDGSDDDDICFDEGGFGDGEVGKGGVTNSNGGDEREWLVQIQGDGKRSGDGGVIRDKTGPKPAEEISIKSRGSSGSEESDAAISSVATLFSRENGWLIGGIGVICFGFNGGDDDSDGDDDDPNPSDSESV